MRTEIEDGMGFGGLVSSREEKQQEQELKKAYQQGLSAGNAGYKEPADIYELKLHQTIDIQKNNAEYLPFRYVTRVPGGWIYSNYNTDSDTYADKLFIPFDNDMQKAGSL